MVEGAVAVEEEDMVAEVDLTRAEVTGDIVVTVAMEEPILAQEIQADQVMAVATEVLTAELATQVDSAVFLALRRAVPGDHETSMKESFHFWELGST